MTDTATVAAWYNQNAASEHNRLTTFSIEYTISLHAILECAHKIQATDPRVGLRVLDLGEARDGIVCPVELARRGHNVTLADISASEIQRARDYAAHEGVHLEKIAVVDAARVSEHDVFCHDHYDLVLCQGPFYHLLELQEREKLLRDCAEMCKPGGFVLTAFVTKWAHLRDIAQRDPERLVREAGFYARYMRDGVYDRVPGRTGHHIATEEIQSLFQRSFQRIEHSKQLQIRRVWACESFLGGRLSQNLSSLSPESFRVWVNTCLEVASRPDMLGAADHLLVVSQKPE